MEGGLNAPDSAELRLQQFLDICKSMSAQRRDTADFRLYEALKRDLRLMNLSAAQFSRGQQAAAKAAGV